MKKYKIAYQGVKGAYSYIAALEYFGQGHDLIECESFQLAFENVLKNNADYAMIPIENSTAGRVADVYLLLKNKPIHILGEFFLPIRHCLVGFKGVKLKDIEAIYSHPQALMQCENNIHKLGYTRVSSLDTAGAVKQIADIGDQKNAAIASSFAAKENGLEVLIDDFQDFENNTTRFVVIGSKEMLSVHDKSKNYITTLIFDIMNKPSSLYDSLKGFSEENVNISKLESYTASDQFKLSHFYIDIEGHVESSSIKKSIEKLKMFTNKVTLIGCYESDSYRQNMR
jgi:prephenate dehydratase